MGDLVITKRNPYHYDIWLEDRNGSRRIYRIRGEKNNIVLYGDNDWEDKSKRYFSSVQSCMTEISAEFMHEYWLWGSCQLDMIQGGITCVSTPNSCVITPTVTTFNATPKRRFLCGFANHHGNLSGMLLVVIVGKLIDVPSLNLGMWKI